MRPWIFETLTFLSPAWTPRMSAPSNIATARNLTQRAQSSLRSGDKEPTGSISDCCINLCDPLCPLCETFFLREQRIGLIDDTVLHHAIDIGSVLDVVERVRFQDHEVGEVARLKRADLPARFAAKNFRGVRRRALENLHRSEP